MTPELACSIVGWLSGFAIGCWVAGNYRAERNRSADNEARMERWRNPPQPAAPTITVGDVHVDNSRHSVTVHQYPPPAPVPAGRQPKEITP